MLYILLIFAGLALSIIIYSLALGITPNPTNRKVLDTLLIHLPPLHSGKIVELGSGWGNIAFYLAKQLPGCTVIGYELSPVPWIWSSLMHRIRCLTNVQLIRRNFYEVSLEDASLVVCYLFSGAMLKLKKKFESELRSGTTIISHTFSIPGWAPSQILEVKDLYRTKIFICIDFPPSGD